MDRNRRGQINKKPLESPPPEFKEEDIKSEDETEINRDEDDDEVPVDLNLFTDNGHCQPDQIPTDDPLQPGPSSRTRGAAIKNNNSTDDPLQPGPSSRTRGAAIKNNNSTDDPLQPGPSSRTRGASIKNNKNVREKNVPVFRSKLEFTVEMQEHVGYVVQECIKILKKHPHEYHPFYLTIHKWIGIGLKQGHISEDKVNLIWEKCDTFAAFEFQKSLENSSSCPKYNQPHSENVQYILNQNKRTGSSQPPSSKKIVVVKNHLEKLLSNEGTPSDLKTRLKFFNRWKSLTSQEDCYQMNFMWSRLLVLSNQTQQTSQASSITSTVKKNPKAPKMQPHRLSNENLEETDQTTDSQAPVSSTDKRRAKLAREAEKKRLRRRAETPEQNRIRLEKNRKRSQEKRRLSALEMDKKAEEERNKEIGELRVRAKLGREDLGRRAEYNARVPLNAQKRKWNRLNEEEKVKEKEWQELNKKLKDDGLTVEEKVDIRFKLNVLRKERHEKCKQRREMVFEGMTEEQRWRLKMNTFLEGQAVKAKIGKKDRSQKSEDWKVYESLQAKKYRKELTPERKKRLNAIMNKNTKKWVTKMKEQDPVKWAKLYGNLREYQRRKVANETPEQRQKRLTRYKVNQARRKLKKEMEEDGDFDQEEFEVRLAKIVQEIKVQSVPSTSTYKPRTRTKITNEGGTKSPKASSGRSATLTAKELIIPLPSEFKAGPDSLEKAVQACKGVHLSTSGCKIVPLVTEGKSNSGTHVDQDVVDESWSPSESPLVGLDYPNESCEVSENEDISSVVDASELIQMSNVNAVDSAVDESVEATSENILINDGQADVVETVRCPSLVIFSCEHCMEEFRENDDLRDHVRLKHPGKCWSCPVCDKVILSPTELVEHFQTDHNEDEL